MIDDLFHEDDIENQFIPSPGNRTDIPKLSKINDNLNNMNSKSKTLKSETFADEVRSNLVSKVEQFGKENIKTSLNLANTRNKPLKSKHKSLVRPTPVKNYKLLQNQDPEASHSEDEVISEMRSLTVKPINKENQSFTYSFSTKGNTARARQQEIVNNNEVIVTEVSMKSKRRLIKWLEDINLIRRKAVSIQQFPQYCRNGVIFFDLVNKLQGKTQVLHGVQRNPKNITCITANFDKVLSYLRKYPKMNARYLWAEKLMMEGNSDVIWGFIEDIWYLKHNKISPNEASKTRNSKSKTKSDNFNSSICSFGKIYID